VLIGGW